MNKKKENAITKTTFCSVPWTCFAFISISWTQIVVIIFEWLLKWKRNQVILCLKKNIYQVFKLLELAYEFQFAYPQSKILSVSSRRFDNITDNE